MALTSFGVVGGDDVLVGGGGSTSDPSLKDQLFGEAGDDIEIAGPGGAIMGGEYFDTGFGVEFYEDYGSDVMLAGEGHDEIWTRFQYNYGNDVVENFNPDDDVLGGNHGDMVSIKPFGKERVLGYRWPGADVAYTSLPILRLDGKVSTNEA